MPYSLILTLRDLQSGAETPAGEVSLPEAPSVAPAPSPVPTELYPTFARAPITVQSAIQQNFARGDWENAARVSEVESGWNTRARNLSEIEDSRGLFQINIRAHPQWASLDLYHPWTNAHLAALLLQWAGGKWSPWRNAAGQLGLPR